MSTPPQPRYVRIRLTALAAIAAVPLLALTLATAWGQNSARGGDLAAQYPLQEYLVLEPTDAIFNSIDIAANFIAQKGGDGWIFPDGTQIIAHTFDAGMSSQYTRFVIRVAGPYREDSPYIILRRERVIPVE